MIETAKENDKYSKSTECVCEQCKGVWACVWTVPGRVGGCVDSASVGVCVGTRGEERVGEGKYQKYKITENSSTLI